jgi:hypothetical protein
MLLLLPRVCVPIRPIFSSSSISRAIRSCSRSLAFSPGRAPAALDNGVVQFALALAQRRVEHVFLLGRERALNVHFEAAKKEGAKDLVQLVDENGVARFGEAVGECWDLESGVGHGE